MFVNKQTLKIEYIAEGDDDVLEQLRLRSKDEYVFPVFVSDSSGKWPPSIIFAPTLMMDKKTFKSMMDQNKQLPEPLAKKAIIAAEVLKAYLIYGKEYEMLDIIQEKKL